MTMDPNRVGNLFMCVSQCITSVLPIPEREHMVFFDILPRDILMLLEVHGQMIYMLHFRTQQKIQLPCLKDEHFCLREFDSMFQVNLLEELIQQRVLTADSGHLR